MYLPFCVLKGKVYKKTNWAKFVSECEDSYFQNFFNKVNSVFTKMYIVGRRL